MRTHLALLALALVATAAAAPAPAPSRDVEIVALDYAFNAPATVAAGRTTFRFTNNGKVPHELNVALLKPGITIRQYMDAVNADKPTEPFREGPVGVLFAGPGKRSAAGLSTELLAGRTYAVICIFKDKPGAKAHFALGMFSAITIAPGAAAHTPLTRVDTIAGADYAYVRYPRTVAPGHHSFAFVNEGKQRHEVSMFMLKRGVTLKKALGTDAAGGDMDALIETDLGLLHAPSKTSPLGLLEVDMLPGRDYHIICTFSDDAKSKPHVMLGMLGTIHVRSAR